MPRYSQKQKAALETLMKEEAYRGAVEIIASEGLHGLTLERLAKKIGLSRASLYNYFADRDAVVTFVEERTVEPLISALEALAAGDGSAADKLDAIVRAIFASVRANVPLVVALSPDKYSGRDKRSHLRRRKRGLDLFRRVVREGVDRGEFRDLPPDLVAEAIHATITGLVDNMAYTGEFRKPEELVPTLMTVLLHGLRGESAGGARAGARRGRADGAKGGSRR
jgi:AcrR family transcriptional regulator